MKYKNTNLLESKKLTMFNAERIENIIANAKRATRIDYRGSNIEVTFTNKGKFDGSEVIYILPLQNLNPDQIYDLLSHKKRQRR